MLHLEDRVSSQIFHPRGAGGTLVSGKLFTALLSAKLAVIDNV